MTWASTLAAPFETGYAPIFERLVALPVVLLVVRYSERFGRFVDFVVGAVTESRLVAVAAANCAYSKV